MNSIKVNIYTEQGNNAVIKLPERSYPGVVIQGDTLLNLTKIAEEMLTEAKKASDENLIDLAEDVYFGLNDILDSLKNTVHDLELDVPYLNTK